jgi:hypothetical protein
MEKRSREIYVSANGDTWNLVHDPVSHRLYVEHIPNEPSGGKSSQFKVGTFLAENSPQQAALLRLIATLCTEAAASSDRLA